MRTSILALMVLLVGCAAQQVVTLLPRAPATERGTGILDRMTQELTVTVEGNNYRGRSVLQTGTTTNIFGVTSTQYSNRSTALLIGDTGQMRCEFSWDYMMIQATGVCVDSRNITYDILITNP